MRLPRSALTFAVVSLILSFIVVFYFNQQPGYTDSFYHYNAAVRVAEGDGFVDDYLWTYIGAPDSLPAPSHLYWMPGTTIISALGMFVFSATYSGASIGLAFCLWGASVVAFWLGKRLAGTNRVVGKRVVGTNRHAWQAGIIILFGGFFMRFWGQTDTFAPYAFFGAMALVFIGLGISAEKNNLKFWIAAGVFSALSHLIRTDGLIMVLVGWSVLFFPFDFFRKDNLAKLFQQRIIWLVVFTLAYLVAMSPWMIRNLNVIGTPLAVGGTQGAWFTEYNDLFNYPPDASPETLFADGYNIFIQSRMDALFSGGGALINFIAVEGIIILSPFILVALWIRRDNLFLRPVWIFAIGIHLAFSLVFPFPGIRGGLFHAVAALMPFWAILGLIGIDDTIEAIAKIRHSWNEKTAKPIFSTFVVLLIVYLSLQIALPARYRHLKHDSAYHQALADIIPDGVQVMINDPSQMYYFTGIGGVAVPNESPDIALEIAEKYGVDYLVLEVNGIPKPMQFDEAPDFLTPIEFDIEGIELYAIERN